MGAAVAFLIGLPLVVVATAQTQPTDNLVSLPPVAPKKIEQESASDQPPSPADTMRVFNAVQPWVRAWAVPGEDFAAANTGADGQQLAPQWGVCINLRLHGQLIGRGVAMVSPDSAEPDARLVARAAAAAVRAADAKLPVPNDLMREAAIKQLTPDIQISLELAGAAVPISADTWTLVDTSLVPGLDGVVVRAGDGEARAEFPSAMMMGNSLPQKSTRALMATAIGEGGAAAVLDQPREIREKRGVRVWRFRVAHLAQTGSNITPRFLYRGDILVDQAGITTSNLRAMALAGAKNLYERFASDSLGKPRDTGYVLANLAVGGVHTCGVEPADREALISLDRKSVTPSSVDVLPSTDERDITCVAIQAVARDRGSVAMSKPKYIDPTAEFWRRASPTLRRAFDESTGFDQSLPKVSRGIVAWALVVRAKSRPSLESPVTPDEVERRVRIADAAVRRAFAETAQGELVSMMPWLGWAEIELADLKTAKTGVVADIPSAPALRQMRTEVWKHQLDALDAGTDGADMVGGIVFTSGNTSPLPTWQCVRPLAFLATMLGDDRLTEPQERALELARLLHAFRFLRQLQVDDSCGWMYPNPAAVIGGMRAATWDHTMPPDATSLTLLAVVELLKSMEKVEAEMEKERRK